LQNLLHFFKERAIITRYMSSSACEPSQSYAEGHP
jgi:hypothetical protein